MGVVSHIESVSGNAGKPPNHTSSKDNVQGKFWKVNYHLAENESYEYVFNLLRECIVPFCSEYIFAEEHGKSGKTRHIEGAFITREDRKRRTAIQSCFKFSDCQKSQKRNWQACIKYCSKEGGRIIHSDGVRPVKPIKVITDLKPYQTQIIDIVKTEPDDRTIHWFYGPKNIGKSKILKKLCVEHRCHILPITERHALSQVFKSHEEKDVYCMNLTADESAYQTNKMFSILEAIKDGMFSASFGTEANGMCLFNDKHLIVMANERPDMTKTHIDPERFNLFKINKDFSTTKETIIIEDKGGYQKIDFKS